MPQSNLQRNWKLIKWLHILLVIMSRLHRNNAAVCSLQSALCLWPTLFYQWVFFSLVVEARTQNFSAIQGENIHNCSNCILVLSLGLISLYLLIRLTYFNLPSKSMKSSICLKVIFSLLISTIQRIKLYLYIFF